MKDETEEVRKALQRTVNTIAEEDDDFYEHLVEKYGEEGVWDTEGAGKEFIFQGFMAPFAFVKQRSSGIEGTLMFSHHPRWYFDWSPEGK